MNIEIVFLGIFGKQLLGFLTAGGVPAGEFGFVDFQSFVGVALRVKYLCAHIPGIQAKPFFGTALKDFITDCKKFILMRYEHLGAVISRTSADFPHIVVHYPVIVGIVVISLCDNLPSLFPIAHPIAFVKRDSIVYLSLNFLLIVAHQLIQRHAEIVCKRL